MKIFKEGSHFYFQFRPFFIFFLIFEKFRGFDGAIENRAISTSFGETGIQSQNFQASGGFEALKNDAAILLQLKALWDTNQSPFFDSWQYSNIPNVCNWTGITCHENYSGIYSLIIGLGDNTNITGPIPDIIGGFSSIGVFSITHQSLHGAIPSSLRNLTKLSYFNVSGNNFGPAFPDVTGLPLETLDLSANLFSADVSTLSSLVSANRTLKYLVFPQNTFNGSFPSFFCELLQLRSLSFSFNQVSGTIPACIANLQRLELLDCSLQAVGGSFPLPLTKCKSLISINFKSCHFFGKLPSEIGSLTSLEFFDASFNNFEGPIPPEIGNLKKLKSIMLRGDKFSGSLPLSLKNCARMESFSIGTNNFSGVIPAGIIHAWKGTLLYFSANSNNFGGGIPKSFAECRILWQLELTGNNFVGNIPENLCSNTALSTLRLGNNSLNGSLPEGLSECSNLTHIDVHSNNISGAIPSIYGTDLPLSYFDASANRLTGNLPQDVSRWVEGQMNFLNLGYNSLNGSINEEIGSIGSLATLQLNDNRFTGSLPLSLSRNKKLTFLDLTNSQISGGLWQDLSQLGSLKYFLIGSNNFFGSLPNSIQHCSALVQLDFSNNGFSGSIPPEIAGLSLLNLLDLSNNQFSGPLPPSLGNLTKVLSLNLSGNSLSGSLPPQIGNLTNLKVLDLSANQFSGSFPEGLLQNPLGLVRIVLSNNSFSGGLSESGWLKQAPTFSSLDLSYNSFSGHIPSNIALLTSLKSLLLEKNSFSGQIPSQFANLSSLVQFNVSYNQLTGSIPGGRIANFTVASFEGNPALCGPPLTTNCVKVGSGSLQGSQLVGVIVGSVVVAVLFMANIVALVLALLLSRNTSFVFEDVGDGVSLELVKAVTENFHEKYKLGTGGSGVVYKATLPSGRSIAVKRFHNILKSTKTLTSEVKSMAQIRHKNLATLIACFVDDKDILLAYAYVPGGDMSSLFHAMKELAKGRLEGPEPWVLREAKKGGKSSWRVFLNLSLGTARGLRYLHFDLPQPIIHRDVKLANVLVGEDGNALLTDFGLSRLVHYEGTHHTTKPAGTVGYVAPECTERNEASVKSDVFSFGVFLLVVVTGKSPAYASLGDEDGLVSWSKLHGINGGFKQVYSGASKKEVGEAKSVLELAWKCVEERPADRPDMAYVVKRLEFIVGDANN